MRFVDQPGDDLRWSNTLLIVTADHNTGYLRLHQVLGRGDLPAQEGACPACSYPEGQVSYGTTEHTNELVRLYARGAAAQLLRRHEGAWYPGTDILDNTHLFDVIAEATGLPQRSPLAITAEPQPGCALAP